MKTLQATIMPLKQSLTNALASTNSLALSERLASLVTLIMLTILAYQLAELSWQLLPETHQDTPVVNVAKKATTKSTSLTALRIEKWHLFGEKKADSIAAPQRPEKIPETKLKLTLRGIIASNDPQSSGAIIATANGKENYYTINATIPGGATLTEVNEDHVVFKRNNRFERLDLPKESIAIPTNTNNAKRSTSRRSHTNLKEYRKSLIKNPQSLSKLVNITPFNQGGRFIGYRLRPGKERAIFAQLGLVTGDVVTAINGMALDTPAKGLSVLSSLTNDNRFVLDILRNNQAQSIVVNMD